MILPTKGSAELQTKQSSQERGRITAKLGLVRVVWYRWIWIPTQRSLKLCRGLAGNCGKLSYQKSLHQVSLFSNLHTMEIALQMKMVVWCVLVLVGVVGVVGDHDTVKEKVGVRWWWSCKWARSNCCLYVVLYAFTFAWIRSHAGLAHSMSNRFNVIFGWV